MLKSRLIILEAGLVELVVPGAGDSETVVGAQSYISKGV